MREGDGFSLPQSEPGSVFKFLAYVPSEGKGGEHVSAWGGSKDPNGQRQFRDFYAHVVREDARKATFPEKRSK